MIYGITKYNNYPFSEEYLNNTYNEAHALYYREPVVFERTYSKYSGEYTYNDADHRNTALWVWPGRTDIFAPYGNKQRLMIGATNLTADTMVIDFPSSDFTINFIDKVPSVANNHRAMQYSSWSVSGNRLTVNGLGPTLVEDPNSFLMIYWEPYFAEGEHSCSIKLYKDGSLQHAIYPKIYMYSPVYRNPIDKAFLFCWLYIRANYPNFTRWVKEELYAVGATHFLSNSSAAIDFPDGLLDDMKTGFAFFLQKVGSSSDGYQRYVDDPAYAWSKLDAYANDPSRSKLTGTDKPVNEIAWDMEFSGENDSRSWAYRDREYFSKTWLGLSSVLDKTTIVNNHLNEWREYRRETNKRLYKIIRDWTEDRWPGSWFGTWSGYPTRSVTMNKYYCDYNRLSTVAAERSYVTAGYGGTLDELRALGNIMEDNQPMEGCSPCHPGGTGSINLCVSTTHYLVGYCYMYLSSPEHFAIRMLAEFLYGGAKGGFNIWVESQIDGAALISINIANYFLSVIEDWVIYGRNSHSDVTMSNYDEWNSSGSGGDAGEGTPPEGLPAEGAVIGGQHVFVKKRGDERLVIIINGNYADKDVTITPHFSYTNVVDYETKDPVTNLQSITVPKCNFKLLHFY